MERYRCFEEYMIDCALLSAKYQVLQKLHFYIFKRKNASALYSYRYNDKHTSGIGPTIEYDFVHLHYRPIHIDVFVKYVNVYNLL